MLICEVRILSSLETLVFTLSCKSKGAELWESVLRVITLAEPQYFGLQYTDEYNQKCWLDFKANLRKQLGKTSSGACGESILFDVKVKFWPEDPASIEDDFVKCLLVMQLQESFLENRFQCGRHTLVKIGAYLLQIHVGSAGSEILDENYSSQFCLVPGQTPEMEKEMERLHQSDFCKNLSASECDKEILRLCGHLDTYGVYFFNALDGDGSNSKITLGIGINGISVYIEQRKINSFPWIMIKKARCTSKCFFLVLYSTNGRLTEVGFKMDKWNCRHLWRLFVDFHAFYRLPVSVNSNSLKQYSIARQQSRPVEARDSTLPLAGKGLGEKPNESVILRKTRFGSARRKIVSERMTADRIISATLPRSTSSSGRRLSSNSEMGKSTDTYYDDIALEIAESSSCSSDASPITTDSILAAEDSSSCPLLSCEGVSLVDIKEVAEMVRRLSTEPPDSQTSAYFLVACEIRDTERSYFRDLKLLHDFRRKIESSRLLLPKQIADLFGDLDLIETFHRHFLAELEDRLCYWNLQPERFKQCVIGDIMKRRMACMKVYQNYVTNESKIFELLNYWQNKRSDFAKVCAKFEEGDTSACRKPVTELFYRPFQRMVHYKELLKRLLLQSQSRKLPQDLADTKDALEYIETALKSVNTSTKAAENARKMFRLQRELVGVTNLLTAGRKFIMEGMLLRLGRSGTKPKIFLLLSDCLLRAVKHSTFYGTQLVAEKVYALKGMQVDNEPDLSKGPYLGFRLTINSGSSFILIAGSSLEKKSWLAALQEAIESTNERTSVQFELPVLKRTSTLTRSRTESLVTQKSKRCCSCQTNFGLFTRKRQCSLCFQFFCKNCSSNFTRSEQAETLKNICDMCYDESIKSAQMRDWHSAARSTQRRVSSKSGDESDNATISLNSPTFQNEPILRRKSAGEVLKDQQKAPSLYSSSSLATHNLYFLPSLKVSSQLDLQRDGSDVEVERGRKINVIRRNATEKRGAFQSSRVLLSLSESLFSREVDMSGYLLHKVKGKDGWKKFWLVLEAGYLNFFRNHEDSHLLLHLPLPEYELSASEKRDQDDLSLILPVPCVFKLFTSSVVHYFLADNKYTMDRWVEVLVCVVKRCLGLLNTMAKHKRFSKRRMHTSN